MTSFEIGDMYPDEARRRWEIKSCVRRFQVIYICPFCYFWMELEQGDIVLYCSQVSRGKIGANTFAKQR